jgi:hypothetical protein
MLHAVRNLPDDGSVAPALLQWGAGFLVNGFRADEPVDEIALFPGVRLQQAYCNEQGFDLTIQQIRAINRLLMLAPIVYDAQVVLRINDLVQRSIYGADRRVWRIHTKLDGYEKDWYDQAKPE